MKLLSKVNKTVHIVEHEGTEYRRTVTQDPGEIGHSILWERKVKSTFPQYQPDQWFRAFRVTSELDLEQTFQEDIQE